jgi:hypothetical protein
MANLLIEFSFVSITDFWIYVREAGLEKVMTQRTFQIDMPKVGKNYADGKDVVNWRLGPTGYEVPLQ